MTEQETAVAPRHGEPPPLIPREVLFGNPERATPRLSPDGAYLAYLAPDERDVLQVWVRTLGEENDRAVTADKRRGIRLYYWTYNPGQLIYGQDADGDENWHLYLVDINKGSVRDLTPFEGVRAEMVALERDLPRQALVGLNLEDRTRLDVYRVDLQNGAVELDTENPGNIVGWTTDAQLQVRAASAATPDGGFDLLVRETPDAGWKTMRHWGPDDEGSAASFSRDGSTLYVLGSHEANAQRLLALDVASGVEEVIAEDPQYDVHRLELHPVERTVQAVSFERDREEWTVLDPRVEADFAAIASVRPGDFWIASRDLADATWLVGYTTDDGPIYYHTYDRSSGQSALLFSHQPKLENLPLSARRPVSYQARDGLTIHGYLTLPVGVEPRDLPAVLMVHGGPWARDGWGFDAAAQWLANRGYAVLQPNFRGSTGYGKDFLNAGNREWGARMHDDLLDGVEWLVDQGIADRERVAIMGGSYGGYATLVGLAFTPDVFAAGVDIVGPSNLITLLESIPPYWEPIRALFSHRIGDPETEPEFLKSRSPLFRADRIAAPLLIAQGANDPRVKQAESEQIVAAMREAGRPVEYIVYTDEGHGFARPENRMHFFARAEEFLAKHLGGRSEPAGEIAGHSGVEG
jgi:dipeptidyl aminopeptidase/acylaminoacyl peptidase